MNEYNYNKEDPDEHWEGFKKLVILAVIIIIGTVLYFIFK